MPVSFDAPPSPRGLGLRGRVAAIALAVAALNLAAGVWALAVICEHPALEAIAVLAYVLGLRHAVDPDHIATIDNVTRKFIQAGERPADVGFWFAIGHSSLMILVSAGVAIASTQFTGLFSRLQSAGSLVGAMASASILLVLGLGNLRLLAQTWSARGAKGQEGSMPADQYRPAQTPRRIGPVAWASRRAANLITRPWHMALAGLLFALGFDTATEISLFGLTAAQASGGVHLATTMVFPVLFTAGMALVDTADGVMMLGAYSWAFVKPQRTVTYNLAVTLASVVVALLVSAFEFLKLASDHLRSGAFIPAWIARAEHPFGLLGVATVAAFALGWAGSWALQKARAAGLRREGAP